MMSRAYWVESNREGGCMECSPEERGLDITTGHCPNVKVLAIEIGASGSAFLCRLCRRHTRELINCLRVALSDPR